MKPIRFYLPLIALMCIFLGNACTKDEMEPIEEVRENKMLPSDEAYDHAVDRKALPAVDPSVPVKSKRIIKPLPRKHPLPRVKKSREASDPSVGRD